MDNVDVPGRGAGGDSAKAEVSTSKAVFLEKVRQSSVACQDGDFERAVRLYTEAIALDPANHILYGNRSAALIKLGRHAQALRDAVRAKEINPKWAKAYYRQGIALQCQDKHAEALTAFASGLAQDAKSTQLLDGLVDAAMKSPLRVTLEPTYKQLHSMQLSKNPFVIISVIGQELLAAGNFAAASVVLEAALLVGTCSLKLRGSVFSALSSTYWALNNLDDAISYMQKDLAITKSLGDVAGECRAHGNLGSAYFSKRNYKEALTSHRYQLVLAMKCNDSQAAASALTSLGHVYTAVGDFPNALASHQQCVQLVRQMGDPLQEARETGNVGAVHLAMGDFEQAVECHMRHLQLAKQMGSKAEEARAHSNLGSSHHFKRNFEKAIWFHERVLQLSKELGERSTEARAYAGLGHAARCLGDYARAQHWHTRQLEMALAARDRVGEGRACSNLGIVYQLMGDHGAALRLHRAHLGIARSLQDAAGMGRAYGNMGNAHSARGNYEQAIRCHKQELLISKGVNDRSSEASTHGNLAVAYQALGVHQMALVHYHSHLNIARELKDTTGEACALLNMANCYSSCGDFARAVSYYESHLMLSQELQDVEGEARACHFLGFAHYCLGNHREAVRYYNQDLALARHLQDGMSVGRAYCNLGLAHAALGNNAQALECQKYFLAIAHMMKHTQGKFRALGNIGDILLKMSNTDEALRVFQKKLQLSKQTNDKGLEAGAYEALGLVYRTLRQYDKALGYHTQELTLRQESGEVKGECRAHGHLGAVHMCLGNYTNAIKCYEEQLERAKDLKDLAIEAQACGNLGIARLNMGHHEEAIGYFEQQLATLEQVPAAASTLDKGSSYGNLGECYDALGDYEEAVKCHEQYLAIALTAGSLKDQDRAYRGLGNSHRCLGNLQQTLVCFEKRLVVSHELGSAATKASAYGELGSVHSLLGNYEQALACLEHQLSLTRSSTLAGEDRAAEADSLCGLGTVYQLMGDYQMALRYHQMDLAIAEETGNMVAQGRAFGNLGVANECLGNFEQAIRYQEQHLSISAQVGDRVAKTLAFSSLGRIHHALGHLPQAVSYLQQGLQIAEQVGRHEDEAKIRHRLGLALWGNGDLEGAQLQLYRAADLFEGIRRECQGGTDYRLSLFDLQTASYQALQRVLVSLGRTDEALVVAERGRTRAFVDLLLERQGGCGGGGGGRGYHSEEPSSPGLQQLLAVVNRQKAVVLYYSLAAGYLYMWLIFPDRGIIKFHECCVSDLEVEQPSFGEDAATPSTGSLLEQYIQNVREALGVESLTTAGGKHGETEGEGPADVWGQHLEELGDKLNAEGDRSGFLRMVNRSHAFNSSSYSLSSLFSLGSWSGSLASGSVGGPGAAQHSGRMPSGVNRRPAWTGPACLRALYDLLLGPAEDCLPPSCMQRELVVVLEGDLYLVPFAVLRGGQHGAAGEHLCERFDLMVAPSIGALRRRHHRPRGAAAAAKSEGEEEPAPSALVVGNPRLPPSVTEQWGWADIPYAEQEARCVGEILGATPTLGAGATREAVLSRISQVEVVHLAAHVSWKLSAIVLAPPTSAAGGPAAVSPEEPPSLSEFLLTAADLLNLRLTAKLVVLSSCHTRSHHGRAHSDGVVGLTRALLAAGAQCVLVSLWPVPDTAVKILLRTFYSSLLQGARVSRALSEAMQTVQNTKHFAHPANWGGFLLVGHDVKLSSKVALMGQALCELLRTPDTCRDSLRVVLHLVEKSLQRIHWGQRNAMYTTQKSIEKKVGPARGWKDLLVSVGFRFEPAANGIPASVFFPQSDPGQRLTQCSASLQALLGLSTSSLNAFSKLLSSPESADGIINLVRQALAQTNMKDGENESVEIPVGVKLWQVSGCHELLASLGFWVSMEVGEVDVTLRASKQASKRQLQFALQALLALFDTQEAPKSLSLENSSSSESLASGVPSSEDSAGSDSPLPPLPTAPHFYRGLAPGCNGAFSPYVPNRGEPDGGPPPPPIPKSRAGSNAFTPSPVERPPTRHQLHQRASATMFPLYGHRGNDLGTAKLESPKPSPRLSLTLAHQTRIRALYPDLPEDLLEIGLHHQGALTFVDGGSHSATSALHNWESGHATVRRQTTRRNAVIEEDPTGREATEQIDSEKCDSDIAKGESGGEGQSNGRQEGPPPTRDFQGVPCVIRNHDSSIALDDLLEKLNIRVEGSRAAKDTGDRRRNFAAAVNDVSALRSRNPSSHDGSASDIFGGAYNAHVMEEFGRQRPLVADQRTASPSQIEDLDRAVMSVKSNGAVTTVPPSVVKRMCGPGEDPISEVYHDRSVGLDMAPSLSALLVSAMEAVRSEQQALTAPPVVQANNLDHRQPTNHADPLVASGLSSFVDTLYATDLNDVGDDHHHRVKEQPPKPATRPTQPALAPSSQKLSWSAELPPTAAPPAVPKRPPPPPTKPRPRPPSPPRSPPTDNFRSRQLPSASESLPTRDDGDGHSMTESHYGGPAAGRLHPPPASRDSTQAQQPKGTQIQSAHSSFTLYRPHREHPRLRVEPVRSKEVANLSIATPRGSSSRVDVVRGGPSSFSGVSGAINYFNGVSDNANATATVVVSYDRVSRCEDSEGGARSPGECSHAYEDISNYCDVADDDRDGRIDSASGKS